MAGGFLLWGIWPQYLGKRHFKASFRRSQTHMVPMWVHTSESKVKNRGKSDFELILVPFYWHSGCLNSLPLRIFIGDQVAIQNWNHQFLEKKYVFLNQSCKSIRLTQKIKESSISSPSFSSTNFFMKKWEKHQVLIFLWKSFNYFVPKLCFY